ncbi:DUF1361 domain-containing protein [Aureispira sp. CCB-QB1]|uniref:DUF1361 domain-containing protein n=1 Tax=Aureispira sp. CCB-QB1 TaxID=1313421 RepID=UPI0006979788|nr:DUF1361 domain-containing protein [Aureispira sp. CCB-QB1]
MKSFVLFCQGFISKYPFFTALSLLFLFNFCLVISRIVYAQERYFLFLVWNLFLAFLPLLFIHSAKYLKQQHASEVLVWGVGGVSLLFLPNSPYIITDLFHLIYWKHTAPLWFDTLLIFSYASTGVVLFYATLLMMEQLLKMYFKTHTAILILLGIIFLNAFGIYLGRYMRFNSWDIISNPIGLIEEILRYLSNPMGYPRIWGITFTYGMLFGVGYCCIKLFQQTIQNEQSRSV